MSAAGSWRVAGEWGAALAIGAAAVAGAAAFFLLAVGPATAGPRWHPATAGLKVRWDTPGEEAHLLDPSALFLPGPATAAAPAAARPAGAGVAFSRLAQWSPPELAFRTGDLQVPLPPPVRVPDSAAAALDVHPPGNPAAGFARTEAPVPVLPPRNGRIEVTDLRTGEQVYAGPVPAGFGPDPDAPPQSYVLTVSPAGPVAAFAQPGSAAAAAQKLLDAALGPRHRLAPGSYRISVGP